MANTSEIWAVVPAAGVGSRMRQPVPKQYLRLHGKTVLEHTLDSLLACSDVAGVVVCISADDQWFKELSVSQNRRIKIVDGGATRAESVLSGLHYLANKQNQAAWALVHDAARPCVLTSAIDNLIDQLRNDSVGGILAVPVKDTLKRANADQSVAKTIDRTDVWHAQTPQMFRIEILMDSLIRALDEGVEITDEASALEWTGYTPRLIRGDETNLKITTPNDLVLAEFLLKAKSSTITS